MSALCPRSSGVNSEKFCILSISWYLVFSLKLSLLFWKKIQLLLVTYSFWYSSFTFFGNQFTLQTFLICYISCFQYKRPTDLIGHWVSCNNWIWFMFWTRGQEIHNFISTMYIFHWINTQEQRRFSRIHAFSIYNKQSPALTPEPLFQGPWNSQYWKRHPSLS